MSNYFQAIRQKDEALIPALEYYNKEYEEGRKEVNLAGKDMRTACSTLASFLDKRLEQYNELVAILKHFEIKLNIIKAKAYNHYLEHYQRQLSSSDIRAYVDGDEDVVAMQKIINEITLIKNKFESLKQTIDMEHFQLSNISRLLAAGVDNVIL